jgi:hypothetical protein
MILHLAEISVAVASGAHAVVLLDQAGWHLSSKLLVPANIRISRKFRAVVALIGV